jgi:transcriptional regulator with XRE-family HTH domain
MPRNPRPTRAHDNDEEHARDGAERLLRDLTRQAEEEGADPAALAVKRGRTVLGASLLSLRSARGLSQSELAQLSGVEQADISRIERATVDPRASTVLRLLGGLAARITLELEQDAEDQGWLVVDDEFEVKSKAARGRIVARGDANTRIRRAGA